MINKRRGLWGTIIIEMHIETIIKEDYIEENELH